MRGRDGDGSVAGRIARNEVNPEEEDGLEQIPTDHCIKSSHIRYYLVTY